MDSGRGGRAAETGGPGDLITPLRRFERPHEGWPDDFLLSREWLVGNGLGAYSSGTLAGVNTRAYHGLLTAAMPVPMGRLLMLKQLSEEVRLESGETIRLTEDLHAGADNPRMVTAHLLEYRHEWGLPVWRYALGDGVLEKRIVMPHRQNTVFVAYRLVGSTQPLRLRLRPWIHFGTHDNPTTPHLANRYAMNVVNDRYEIVADDFPVLRLALPDVEPRFVVDGGARREIFLRTEADRGYSANRTSWSPGYFTLSLAEERQVGLVASSEPWKSVTAMNVEEAFGFELARRHRLVERAGPVLQDPRVTDLVLAADSFVIAPVGRVKESVRAHAAGDRIRSVIAGYHWFADWGRDTMISLEGLTLTTSRHDEARWILRTYQHYVRDGLLPNFFPEGSEGGVYHTADATLWFFHALHRYLGVTGERRTLELLLPSLRDIVAHHEKGTRFGIGVDPADGLLKQGAEGYQLTWMDAKVDGWVVTPRRGKAVEINALWYNALTLLAGWEDEEGRGDEAARLRAMAARAREAFNRRFWYEAGGYLYDVIDGEHGEDPACRPNQLLSIALDHPVLDRGRWETVVEVCSRTLLTPVGVRSLAPGHPDYKPRYFGDLRSRDAAYHQGTVWAWLIGPFIDAWLKVHEGDTAGARRFLEGLLPHLDEAGIGTISEIFDADEPYTPRGCMSQAWSVAEMLRCWAKTA